MIRRPPRSTQSRSSAASDVYKRQLYYYSHLTTVFNLCFSKKSIRNPRPPNQLVSSSQGEHEQKRETIDCAGWDSFGPRRAKQGERWAALTSSRKRSAPLADWWRIRGQVNNMMVVGWWR